MTLDPALPVSFPSLLRGALGELTQRAAGSLPERTEEPWPPPAGAERAETLFEIVGMSLSLLIVLAAIWFLFQLRR